MRYFLAILTLVVLTISGCEKDDCNKVTITRVGTGTACAEWAIKQNADTYRVDSIPAQYQQEGMVVCADYNLYEDLRMCPCCGGVRASIISISKPE